MKDVEYFTFMMPPSIWKKKPHPSSFKMSIEQAAQRCPEATPIMSTREVRSLPETAEEMQRNQIKHNGRAKTPEEEKLQAWLVSRIGMKSEKLG
ncbi:hypothetical protein [Variovorax paradoxus]|jgi:hypothetical protein|uniref:hypothetical protein n=1 Tax=Variovorax paradoxus TaxID=34073 RepID=UPI001931EDB2|nr:hypothetical protein INQ48_14075 [Variovorax paradoxus]